MTRRRQRKEHHTTKGITWYDDWRGETIVTGLVLFTLLSALISIGRPQAVMDNLPPLTVTIPIDIYLYGFLGAATWAIFSLAAILIPDDGEERMQNEEHDLAQEIKRIAPRTFAALCLAAGVVLCSHLVAESVTFFQSPNPQLQAGAAFIVGFYVERAYIALGALADRILTSLTDEQEGPKDGQEGPRLDTIELVSNAMIRPSQSSKKEILWAWSLFFLSLISIIVAIVLSVNWGDSPPSYIAALTPYVPAATIPFDVYLYAFLGSMGYAFTSLFDNFDRTLSSLFGHALQIPAGPLLAGGFYLLTALLVPPTGDLSLQISEGAAGMAFLIGLYTNVALVTFDVIAAHLLAPFTQEKDNDEETGDH